MDVTSDASKYKYELRNNPHVYTQPNNQLYFWDRLLGVYLKEKKIKQRLMNMV